MDCRCRLTLSDSGAVLVAGTFEHGNESSVSVKRQGIS